MLTTKLPNTSVRLLMVVDCCFIGYEFGNIAVTGLFLEPEATIFG